MYRLDNGQEYETIIEVSNSCKSDPYWKYETVYLVCDGEGSLFMICEWINEEEDPSHTYEMERISPDSDPFLVLSDWLAAQFGEKWWNKVDDWW